MNILLVYATNSGSTFLVSEYIQQFLQNKQHSVTVKQFKEIQPNHFEGFDLIVMGSPSWDYKKKEGMPHHDVMAFIEGNPEINFEGKKFAFFGLGDKNYAYFTGAVDHILQFVKSHGGQISTPPLRINRFYFNDQELISRDIGQWVEGLLV